ncbi:MAG: proteobacterial dedicated sortase system response regulator [Rhodocyclaceae bacterium]|jgi:two-component system OmpR family response regulator|nr:proteobacterial dedicated sortase system response regulator [Rhodocyclaceae bacterium]MCE2723708.1 proteobacterial dedicated sortase system response regulator [Betaproteobacteria bacterium]MCA3017905.1 proteobacterial dedicated sortase system response regulator [Rhodocyclaceae bacterium]MCA3022208.1 proteobacterial dedicated sortase system response regulator [Rhodocyclaceae bacterium]MCA3024151.1 proteobacterial dedicated sortase system response regulator [Rhodocyclaceae bacterium]
MQKRIAIVEDDHTIRANYSDALKRHGYDVSGYADRASAMVAFRLALPDLAIIDIGLGDEIDGGFTLCRDLRALSNSLPIIFLSARDSDFDVVSGLRLGADDYVTKDVSMPHLTARIAALFRRLEAQRAPARAEDVLHRGALVLDINRLSISWKQQEVILTVTEFWMIHALVKFVGHVKNRDQLMREAELTVDDNTITSHMKRIRKKFEVVDNSFDSIETVYGMGYRWRE